MRRNNRWIRSLMVSSILIAAGPHVVAGAPSPTDGGDSASENTLGDIIVTATKRSENLQNIPLAVTAVSGAALARDQVYDIRDLTESQPGVTLTENNPFTQQLNIRGIVTVLLGDPTAEPSVGTFMDGVYIGGEGIAFSDYYDVERLEITRGPQGVLYGKNVVGGAVSVITSKPSFTPSGSIDATYGNLNSPSLSGHLTGPLSDTLAARVAFQFRHSDGYSENVLLDRKMNGVDSYQGRVEFLWTPIDSLRALLSVDYGYERTSGTARGSVDDPTIPGVGPWTATRAALGQTARQTADRVPDYTERNVGGLTLTVDYDVFKDAKVTSTTGVRQASGTALFDQLPLASPPGLLSSVQVLHYVPHSYSEDLRLTGTPTDSAVDYIAGVYASRDVISATTPIDDTTVLPLPLLSGDSLYSEHANINDLAAYVQAGFKVSDQFKITGGVRYTRDKKYGDRYAFCAEDGGDGVCATPLDLAAGQSFDTAVGRTWSATTPQIMAQYQFDPDVMAYLSYGEGFKGGGWDQFPATAAAARIPFNPEHAKNLEIGVKSEFLEHRVRLNVAAFDLRYKDLQVQQVNSACLCLVTSNAGATHNRGVEVESEFIVNDTIRLSAAESYIDGKYVTFVDSQGNNNAGHPVQRTPKSKTNVGFVVSPALGALERSLEWRTDYTYQTRIYLDPSEGPYEGGYGLLASSLTFHRNDSAWSFSLWGKNLTNKLYETVGIPFLGDIITAWAPPRTYGATVGYKY